MTPAEEWKWAKKQFCILREGGRFSLSLSGPLAQAAANSSLPKLSVSFNIQRLLRIWKMPSTIWAWLLEAKCRVAHCCGPVGSAMQNSMPLLTDYNKTVQGRQLVKGKISPFPVLILPVICVAQCDCQRLHLRQHFVSYHPEWYLVVKCISISSISDNSSVQVSHIEGENCKK